MQVGGGAERERGERQIQNLKQVHTRKVTVVKRKVLQSRNNDTVPGWLSWLSVRLQLKS